MTDNRKAAIEAVARARKGGADPTEADLHRAEPFVDDLLAALPHLVKGGGVPSIIESVVDDVRHRYVREDVKK